MRRDYILFHVWPRITKDTKPEQVIKIHEDIWDYVVKYGKKPPTPYIFDCVLCEYRKVTNSSVCLCGTDCHPENGVCNCLYGMYNEWIDSVGQFRHIGGRDSMEKAISLSIKIRDFFKNNRYAKNTFTKIGRELNNKIGGKNDGNWKDEADSGRDKADCWRCVWHGCGVDHLSRDQ